MTSDDLNTYASVLFAASPSDYDSTLSAVTELGLRLADPCYEQALAQGRKPAWHAMGQETSYARSSTLILAPTGAASANWRTQLTAVPGESGLTVPYAPSCP